MLTEHQAEFNLVNPDVSREVMEEAEVLSISLEVVNEASEVGEEASRGMEEIEKRVDKLVLKEKNSGGSREQIQEEFKLDLSLNT